MQGEEQHSAILEYNKPLSLAHLGPKLASKTHLHIVERNYNELRPTNNLLGTCIYETLFYLCKSISTLPR